MARGYTRPRYNRRGNQYRRRKSGPITEFMYRNTNGIQVYRKKHHLWIKYPNGKDIIYHTSFLNTILQAELDTLTRLKATKHRDGTGTLQIVDLTMNFGSKTDLENASKKSLISV